MKIELQEKLQEDFPDLYSKETHPRDPWFGFECGDGWFKLLYDLSEALTKNIAKYYEKHGVEEETYFYATQVKEKYGTLRFYMNYSTDAMEEIIEKACKLSSKTCEECGKEGELNNGPWYEVRCSVHTR